MLLWETLTKGNASEDSSQANEVKRATRAPRLPYDKRCAALTLRGLRCRCRIRKGSDFCQFHDPEVSMERRRMNAAKGGRNSRKLYHIPGGYLRKLTDRAAVGQAMDRLYREVRLGIVTPEMGKVLFDILTRIMDSDLDHKSNERKSPSTRAKANRLRPKVSEALTQAEKSAWRRALANAPADFLSSEMQELSSRLQERPTASATEPNRPITEQNHQPEWPEKAKSRQSLKLQAVS